jgi:isoquinoline 1-oxidoreductase subunit alpha
VITSDGIARRAFLGFVLGQIMAAVALVKEKGKNITDADIEGLRNICRCGTYFRIREAIKAGAENM